MNAIERIDQNARRSRASAFGDLVFLTGQVGDDLSADAATQTRQALAKVDDLLARAGSDRSRVLSATIWLREMADYDAMNAEWDAWVVPEQRPCRACAKVELADPACRVEIIVVAAR